MFRASFGIIHR